MAGWYQDGKGAISTKSGALNDILTAASRFEASRAQIPES
jgi:hypothetical protein